MQRALLAALAATLITACAAPAAAQPQPAATATQPPTQSAATDKPPVQPTPLPTRLRWDFGDMLTYETQPGDSLTAVAGKFNTTPEAIAQQNPAIDFTSPSLLIPGTRLNIPANYAPFMGTSYWIIPDSEFVYSPALDDFSTRATVLEYGGFLSRYAEFAEDKTLPAWEIIERVARDYSISPRLLLALIEHRTGALSQQGIPDFTYPLGLSDPFQTGLHRQLVWSAKVMSKAYYGWRHGSVTEVMLSDGSAERLDFWQNAGTAALHAYFGASLPPADYTVAVSPEGFTLTYARLFGDPFKRGVNLFPVGTQQPVLELPFLVGKTWGYTGGPHPVWGDETPWAALDFAPPAVVGGCGYSSEWVAAMADGIIARSNSAEATVVLDLDGDGNEHTGWVIFYYHLGTDDLPAVGKQVKVGDPIGHPSCEGGRATGTHVHVARRLNGEWIIADGPIPFVLSGWTAHGGDVPYKGTLTFDLPAMRIESCLCVTARSSVTR